MLKRILEVFGVSALGQVINLVFRMISVPLFLNFWGRDLYGEWLIIQAIPSYMVISGTGLCNVAANAMSINNSKGLEKESSAIFQSILIFISCIGVVFLFLSILIGLSFPIVKWLNIRHISSMDTGICIVLLALYTVCFMQGELLLGAFRASGIFAKGLLLNNVLILLENTVLLTAVIFSADILVAAITFVVVRAAGTAFLFLNLIKRAKWIKLGWREARFQVIKTNIIPAVSYIGINISNALSVQGIISIIGVRLGGAAVVEFSVIRTIINLIKQFNSLIYYSVWPELSTALAVDNRLLARKVHRYSCQITLTFTLLNIILLMFLGESVIRLWTSGRVDVDFALFIMMLLAMLPNTLYVTSSYVQVSINKLEGIAVLCLLTSSFSLVASYFTIPALGIIAVPIIQMVLDSLLLVVILRNSLSIVQDRVVLFIRSFLNFEYVTQLKEIPKGIFK